MSLNNEVFTPDTLVDAMHTMRLPHSMTRKVEKERGMGWFDKQREVEKGLSEAARHELMKSMRDATITPPTLTMKAWSGGDDGGEIVSRGVDDGDRPDGSRGEGADGMDGMDGMDGSGPVAFSDRFRGASPPPLSYVGSSPTASKPTALKPWQTQGKKKRRQGVDRMTRSAIKEAFAKQRRAGEAQRRIYAEVEIQGGRGGSHR